MVRESEMYPYVRRILRRHYPKSEGWVIKHRERRVGYEPDFIVERRTFFGQIERVVVEVKAVCKVTPSHVKQINKYVKNLAGTNVKVVEKILVVRAGADISVVPPDIKIIRLRSFPCR